VQDGAAEYQVLNQMTTVGTDVVNAINALPAASGGGDDAAEAQNLVFNQSYSSTPTQPIGWRSGTRKFVIMISDAEPHGAGTAGFAGCLDTTPGPHGLNTATEIAGMAANQRTLLMILQDGALTTSSLACYQSLAAAGFTGGSAVVGGASLAAQIVAQIDSAFGTVTNVHLTVAAASPSQRRLRGSR
jgi:hypothetical protein